MRKPATTVPGCTGSTIAETRRAHLPAQGVRPERALRVPSGQLEKEANQYATVKTAGITTKRESMGFIRGAFDFMMLRYLAKCVPSALRDPPIR